MMSAAYYRDPADAREWQCEEKDCQAAWETVVTIPEPLRRPGQSHEVYLCLSHAQDMELDLEARQQPQV